MVACRYVRLTCARHLRDLEHGHERGLWWDAEQVEDQRLYFLGLRHSKGEWGKGQGQPIVLSPFQLFLQGLAYGWKRADGTRRFRVVYCEIPRKQGKSTQGAGNGLYLAFDDDEPGAEVFSAATKRDQAKIVWGEGKRMVLRCRRLRERVRVLTANLSEEATASKFEPLGADADNLDGLNLHGAIVDELHAHKKRDLWDVLVNATGARRQSLIWVITTAGQDRESICWELHDYSVKLLEGVIDDDSFLPFIATLDICEACRDTGKTAPTDGCPTCDQWDDERVWPKSNPNLGISVKLADLQDLCRRAKLSPAAAAAFKRQRHDIWTQEHSRWINIERWLACSADVADEELATAPCFAGLDLGQRDDLAAFVRIWMLEDGRVAVKARFWTPETALARFKNRPYEAWRADGVLQVTEGDTADEDLIEREVGELALASGVRELAYDRRFASQMALHLQGLGLTLVDTPQGFQLNEALLRLQTLVMDRKLCHGGHRVLAWMASNAIVRHGMRGEIRLDKLKSGDKIDGIAALAMALSRGIVAPLVDESTLMPRGLLRL